MRHLGVEVRPGTKGLRLTRETYATINKRSSMMRWHREMNPQLWDALDERYEDPEHRIYTDDWCAEQQAMALENFDLNMAFFASLDHAEFNDALSAVVASHGMVEVTDLNEWDKGQALYVMVLDDYCQAYVGVTKHGLKDRIRRRWRNPKSFDRLLWGGVNESILSVDSFRPLDTTRLFAVKRRNPDRIEDQVIEAFPPQFLLNRVRGGSGRELGLAARLGVDVVKTRELTAGP